MKKLYYSIGEISEMLNEEQHILRHWEKTFPILKPKKNSSGSRVYNDKDIEVLKAIKILLREKLLSVKAAKDRLKGGRKSVQEVLSRADISKTSNISGKGVFTQSKSNQSEADQNEIGVSKSTSIKDDESKSGEAKEISKVDGLEAFNAFQKQLTELKSVLLDTKKKLTLLKKS